MKIIKSSIRYRATICKEFQITTLLSQDTLSVHLVMHKQMTDLVEQGQIKLTLLVSEKD